MPPASSASSASASPACTGTVPSDWPLARLAAQVVAVPVVGDDVPAATVAVRSGAGGLLLLGREVPPDLGAQLAALAAQAPGRVRPIVMADEEGGAVQRLRPLVGPVPSARTMAATMTTGQVQALAATVGRRMAALGVRMDLAPVLDLDDRPGPSADNPDGTRSFGTDPERTAAYGRAFADGLQSAGVVPVVKHFPGLGGSTGNTDVRAGATQPWPDLRRTALEPFRQAVTAGLPAVMVANATVPGLTERPASVSPEVVTDVLRGQLGFDGLVLTDSLSAGALTAAGYDVPEATVAALRAGADLALYASDVSGRAGTFEATVDAVEQAVRAGSLSRTRLEASVARVLAVKGIPVCPAG